MLKQRVTTALTLLIVLGGLVHFLPASGFVGVVAVVFAIAAWEWAPLSGFTSSTARVLIAVVCAVMILALASLLGFPSDPDAHVLKYLFISSGVWWAIALLWVQSFPASVHLWQSQAVRLLMGAAALLPCAIALIWLRVQGPHIWLLLFLVALVAFADIGAYFAGKAFGKRKLAPKVSPGKSIAGLVGGLISAAVFAFVVAFQWPLPLTLTQWVVICVLTTFASVLGDLFESMMKRHAGVKDSSQILPGHGGVLDRIDGWTAAAPIFVLCLISAGWQ